MLTWLTGKSDAPRRQAAPTMEALIQADLERTGVAGRASRLPAWALLMRSPFVPWDHATSWLGGSPFAPPGFKWPRDANGLPLHFMAQIDLSALQPEPETGARAPGLPSSGALLVFVGSTSATRILSSADVDDGVRITPPADLPATQEHGFFPGLPTFRHWPVTPVAYLDTDGQRPAFLPNPFERPEDWITTCALAVLDAKLVIDRLERELRFGRDFANVRARTPALPENARERRNIESNARHYALMQDRAPAMIAAMTDWLQTHAAEDPNEEVDRTALRILFGHRNALADDMGSYPPQRLLRGDADAVWGQISRTDRDAQSAGDFSNVIDGYRSFVTKKVTDWRGHRLFGLTPPPEYNFENLSGRDCLITVAADDLIGTQSEHEHAMSIWCPRNDLVLGKLVNGLFVRHSNG